MRNKVITFSVLGILLLFIASGLIIALSKAEPGYVTQIPRVVQVENGKIVRWEGLSESKLSNPNFVFKFGIEKDGTYSLALSSLPKGKTMENAMRDDESLGFVTLCLWRDQAGNLISSDCGNIFRTEKSMELKEGYYEIDFYDIPDEETYLSYAKEYLCGDAFAQSFADSIGFDNLPKSGSWSMDYTFEVHGSSPVSLVLRIAILVIGILFSILLIVLLIAMSTKGESVMERYDERQQLEKGRGFRYAFLTTLVYLLLSANLQVVGLSLPCDPSLLYTMGGILGVVVYAVYCIWHESYFALNQKRKTLLFCFALIGLVNLVIAICSMINGSMYQNGRITFRALNLICAIMFLILFAAMCLKMLVNKRAKNTEDDEDDDDAQ